MYKPVLFKKIIYTSTLLALTSLYNTTTFADSPAVPQISPPPVNTAKPAAALKPEQQAAFRKISKEMHERMLREKELHNEVRALAQSDAYDEKKVRALIQKHHKETEEEMVASSKEMNDLYKTLTPEQKKQLDMIRDKTKERRDDMKENMREGMKEKMKEHGEKRHAKDSDGSLMLDQNT